MAKKTAKSTTVVTTRAAMIKTIADKSGIIPVDVDVTLQVFVRELVQTLQAGASLTLRELGVFKMIDGEPTFTPSTALRKRIAGEDEE